MIYKKFFTKKPILYFAQVPIFFLTPIIGLISLVVFSYAPLVQSQSLPFVAPSPPETNAEAYVLLDTQTGMVLASKAPFSKQFPASLTKIMTGMVAFHELENGNVRLDDEVYISEKAWKTGGSRSFIEVNSTIPFEVLLKGMIVQSGNDAAVAIAEHIAGNEESFADLMNLYSESLGLSGTSFANSTGLPHPNEYTTPFDMAILSQKMIALFPLYYPWYSIKEYEHNNIRQSNRNRLLWSYDGADGIKTGYTEEAGYNLVASALRDGMRLIAVVMNAESTQKRTQDAAALLNFGFRFFESMKIFEAKQAILKKEIEGGKMPLLAGVLDDVWASVAKGRYEYLEQKINLKKNLVAPLEQGEEVGEIEVYFDNELLRRATLYSLEPVEKASLLESIMKWFFSFFE